MSDPTKTQSLHLTQNIINYLEWLENKVVVLWFSWWPDSVATYYVIKEYYEEKRRNINNIYLAHFNHGIRLESAQESDYIQSHYKNVVIWAYTGRNHTESHLRQARHDFFQQTLEQCKSQTLILGHNLSDRLETTIMNCERGCWTTWLMNMQAIDKKKYLTKMIHTILRPLLHIPKHVITQYCETNTLHYFSDPSNNDPSTSRRNAIRISIIKSLERNNIVPLVSRRMEIKSTVSAMVYQDMFELFNHYLAEPNIWDGIRRWYAVLFDQQIVVPPKVKKISMPEYFWMDYLYQLEWRPSIEDIIYLLKGIGEYSDIKASYLKELSEFSTTKQSGHKTLWKWILSINNGQIYLYLPNKKFDAWQALRFRLQYNKCDRLIDLKHDTYKNKPISKRLINNKIPSFLRHLVPVYINNSNWSTHYLDNLIIQHINNERQYVII